jgi:AraC-like DNA-binding protein
MEKSHKRRVRQNVISFGPFLLFPAEQILERRVPVRLGDRALAVLLVLIKHAAEVVGAKDLIAKVWPNRAVKQASLRFQIGALRRALGNGKFRYVTDVSRRSGYCFVAPMTRAALTPSMAENGLSTFSSRSARALDAKRPQRVVDFIEAKLETDIKVADLASVAALSQFHFSRAFRRATGKTPHRFVSDRRLEKAKELLAKGTMTLGQIAAVCDFSSQASFTRAFSRAARLPPA